MNRRWILYCNAVAVWQSTLQLINTASSFVQPATAMLLHTTCYSDYAGTTTYVHKRGNISTKHHTQRNRAQHIKWSTNTHNQQCCSGLWRAFQRHAPLHRGGTTERILSPDVAVQAVPTDGKQRGQRHSDDVEEKRTSAQGWKNAVLHVAPFLRRLLTFFHQSSTHLMIFRPPDKHYSFTASQDLPVTSNNFKSLIFCQLKLGLKCLINWTHAHV